MPKPSPKTKLRPQPNVLFEATVRRMLATPPRLKKAAAKKRRPNTRKRGGVKEVNRRKMDGRR